jgi:hypothetical protein
VNVVNKEALLEAIKEPLRLLVLAVIPFLLEYFGKIGTEWAIVLVIILRFVDKYVHELGVEQSTTKVESPLVTGITRF